VAQPYPSGARDAQVMDLSLRSVSGVFAGYVIDLVLLALYAAAIDDRRSC
jgi:hypothetical protein